MDKNKIIDEIKKVVDIDKYEKVCFDDICNMIVAALQEYMRQERTAYKSNISPYDISGVLKNATKKRT